jgi:PIN domain nuclease of toxin-antitoxin system
MAALIYLDTHVVAWAFQGEIERIPTAAQDAIDVNDPLISPIVLVELQYLFEIGRCAQPAQDVLTALADEIGLKVCDQPFFRVASRALDQAWTRDPFDRLIVSQAILSGSPLVTKDRKIHEHYAHALWDLRAEAAEANS